MEAGLLQRQWKGTAYWLAFPLLLTLSYSISHHDLAPPSPRINLVNGLQLDLMVAFSQLRYHPLWLLYLVTSWHTKPARTGNIFIQLPHSIPSPHRVIAISKCKNSLSLILKVPIVYHIHWAMNLSLLHFLVLLLPLLTLYLFIFFLSLLVTLISA